MHLPRKQKGKELRVKYNAVGETVPTTESKASVPAICQLNESGKTLPLLLCLFHTLATTIVIWVTLYLRNSLLKG